MMTEERLESDAEATRAIFRQPGRSPGLDQRAAEARAGEIHHDQHHQ